MTELPFIWVQCKNGNNYDLVDGATGEILFLDVTGRFCDTLFRCLDREQIVYVRQFY